MKPQVLSESPHCRAISAMLSRIGDKWTVLIVVSLGAGPLRFSELKRGIGTISQKMLTATLRNLERDGFVTRQVTDSRPPRVDYRLTDLGHDLLCPVNAMAEWTMQNLGRIEAARARFDLESTPIDPPALAKVRAG